MLTTYSAFLKSVKKRSSCIALFFGACVISIPALGEIKINVVQRNNNGDTYQIGDRIALYLEIPQEKLAQNPTLTFSSEKDLGEQGWYLDPQMNIISGNLRFVVSPIHVGTLTLPSLTIQNQDKNVIDKTEPWTIKVTGPNLDPNKQIDPNKKPEYLPPIHVSLALKTMVLIFLLTLVIVIALFFAIRWYQKNKITPPPPAPLPAPSDPDHLIATKALHVLYEKYRFQHANLKPIAFGVSEILKDYFSASLKIDARESTTQEMMALLRSIGISSQDLKEIDVLFRDLDLIKFTQDENYSHLDESHYQNFKSKAELIIHKWSTALPGGVK